MADDLNSLLQKSTRLAEESADALARGDQQAALRLRLEADLAWKKAVRTGQRDVTAYALSKTPSARERAMSALLRLNVPASGKLIAAYCEARTGEAFEMKGFASIRRDEFRAWSKGSRREIYLVPALEGPWFIPSRGRYALSTWPLTQRIIGPLSPRVAHLKVSLHLADELEAQSVNSDAAARMRKLLTEYVRSVSGALTNPWDSSTTLDTVRIRAAVQYELSKIEADDEAHRKSQAEHALRVLDESKRIWGGKPPEIADDFAI
ncbi:hypothetical protein QFZ99_004749 [Paraburkholderia atlantica]|uniref:hypothetical protein n=1 Tax=Paraburkholderia atlantica TaxID=2654982 RepID=UPI003D227E47